MGWERFRTFVQSTTRIVEGGFRPTMHVEQLRSAMADLVSKDDWLNDSFAIAHANTYQQHLLYCDPLERFSVISFVWRPGQQTPIHDHTTWGVIGQLRGSERSQSYLIMPDGTLAAHGIPETMRAGDVASVGPDEVDIHSVGNVTSDVSVSIHVYGGNMGKTIRNSYDPCTGAQTSFVSGYCNKFLPNIWT